MSFCRFSSDDHSCDLYVYEDCMGGYSIHIAKMRRIFSGPLPPKVDPDTNFDLYLDRHIYLDTLPYELVEITLPHAGEHYRYGLEDLIPFIEELKVLGYIFPDSLIPALEEEVLCQTSLSI